MTDNPSNNPLVDPLLNKIEEDSRYKQEDQEWDGSMSSYLSKPSDLKNYYPPSANINVENFETAILNSEGNIPPKFIMSLNEEELEEFNSLGIDWYEIMNRSTDFYEAKTSVVSEIEETAQRRTKWRHRLRNLRLGLLGIPGSLDEDYDINAEYEKNLDEIEQEKLGDTLSLFETEAESMENVMSDKVPNNVQEGLLGKSWNAIKKSMSNQWKTSVFLGDTAFHQKPIEELDVPENPITPRNLNGISLLVLTGKALSAFGTKIWGQDRTNRNNVDWEKDQVRLLEKQRDLGIRNYEATLSDQIWEQAIQNEDWLAQQILEMPQVNGDQIKAQAIFAAMVEARSPELMNANNAFVEGTYEWFNQQAQRVASGEDTIGEVIVNGLGAYSKYIVGSISTSVFLMSDEEARKMAFEFGKGWWDGWHNEIKKVDYSPARAVGLEGTFSGSMLDLSTSFAFDPTIWFFSPATGARAGAVKQFAHAKYIKGFMNKGIGKTFADDLYNILRNNPNSQAARNLLRNFSDTNASRLKLIVKDDIARGAEKGTSQRFYDVYTDALLRGDNPYVFHKTAWNSMKNKRSAYLIRKAAEGDGKALKSLRKLYTSKNISTKVNLAGPNPKRAIYDALESMAQGTKLSDGDLATFLNVLEDNLDDLYELTMNAGTNFNGSAIAALRTQIANHSDLIALFELGLNRRPKAYIKNLADDTTTSGQNIRNRDLDALPDKGPSLDVPRVTYDSAKKIRTKAKATLKELRKSGAADDIIRQQQAYLERLSQTIKNQEIKVVKGRKEGTTKDYDELDFRSLMDEFDYLGNPETREFLVKILEDANELAGVVKGSKESVEGAKRFTKMLDDFYADLEKVAPSAATGRGVTKIDDVVKKHHRKLLYELDKLMLNYAKALNVSVRSEQQRVMVDALNRLVYKLGWHEKSQIQGGWYTLRSVKGQMYDQAKKLEFKGQILKNDAASRKIAEDLAGGNRVYWIENPVKITKNKKGVVTNIEIDWVTLKIMLDYQDDVGAVSAVLRGQAKALERRKGTKFILNEAEDAFIVSGRSYDPQFLSDVKKQLKLTEDVEAGVLVEDYINNVRNIRKTTNQVVEGELPISPLEFTMMNAMLDGTNIGKISRFMSEKKWAQFLEQFQRAWNFEKVASARTAFVAAFDEILFYKSIFGWKGTTKDYLFHRGVRQTLREIKKIGGINKAMADPKLAKKVNEWVSEALKRQQNTPIEIANRYKVGFDKDGSVELLSNTDAGFFQYAQQHIDSLLKDYGFQQYAQVLNKLEKLSPDETLTQKQIDDLILKGGDEGWTDWFKTSDANYIKGMKLYGYKQGEGVVKAFYTGINKPPVATFHHLTNAEEAWKYYASLKKWYTMGVPANKADDVWNAFLKAARTRATGKDDLARLAMPDDKYLGYIKVPGIRKPNGFLGNRGAGKFLGRDTSLMEQMFGNPAWNRANLFANKAFATRKEALRMLFQSQGKTIIRAEDIGSDLGMMTEAIDPRFMSDMWGMSYFDEQLFKAGYVTDNYLNSLAADFATNEVDDMMLKFHLATPLGKEMRFLAPFGGPWADFWGRYLKDLTRRSQLRGNWWAYTDEATAGNYVKRKLNDSLNYLPNLRRAGYISRIANAELKGTINNPLPIGEDRVMLDFSPVTFLPNGDSPMFAVNPIGGFIPVGIIGAAMNALDDDAYFELQDTLEDLFPSTQFFPPEEQWKYNFGTTAYQFIKGGGVVDRGLRTIRPVIEALGFSAGPKSLSDVPYSLKVGRTENFYMYNNTEVIIEMENWEDIGDFTEYVNSVAKDSRLYATSSISVGVGGALLVPTNLKIDPSYTDVAENWIDFAKTIGVYEDVVRQSSKDLLDNNPYSPDNQIQVMKDINSWWFGLGDSVEGQAKKLLYQKEYPQIIALTAPGYTVTELGARLLPQREGKKYFIGEIYRSGVATNLSMNPDYLAEGLIQVRLPDEKVKHIIHENAAWESKAVSLVWEHFTEIANRGQLEDVFRDAEKRGISPQEILENSDMKERYGFEISSADVTNLEDLVGNLDRKFNVADINPEVLSILEILLEETPVENFIDSRNKIEFYDIVPYLYGIKKSTEMSPAYVYSDMSKDSQRFTKGLQLLDGLTKAQMFWEEEVDGKESIEFLNTFINKMYALKREWELNGGQVANNEEIQNLVEDVFETFTIFNHIVGDINSIEGIDVLSGEQWWNYYIKPTFKTLDLEWKMPVPAEGPIVDKTFTVQTNVDTFDANFQTIQGKKPFKATRINGYKAADGDTLSSLTLENDVEAIRIIGIMAYEMGLDPLEYPQEAEIAIQQKHFLQQLLETYEGRLYYVTDRRFGNENRQDNFGRITGWLFVENGINGDLADGLGEYIFFGDHFSPADGYYGVTDELPTVSRNFEKPDTNKYNLDNYFIESDEVKERDN